MNIQNKFSLEVINKIIQSARPNQNNQQLYTISAYQRNNIKDIIEKNIKIINTMNDGKHIQAEETDYGCLNQLIRCYKTITADIQNYYGKNISTKQGYKSNAKFWQKTLHTIKKSSTLLQQQRNKLTPLKKQQISALQQLNKHLIYGEIIQFNKKHTNYKCSYHDTVGIYHTQNGYLLQYNLNSQILKSISQQFIKLRKFQNKLLQKLKIKYSGQQYNKKTMVDRCTSLVQQMQLKYTTIKDTQIKWNNLQQAQNKIIKGESIRPQTYRYYQTYTALTFEQQILSPMVQDYKIIKQVLDKLKQILNDKNWYDPKLTTSQSCRYLLQTLQNKICEASNTIHQEIGSEHKGSINTIGGLISLISSYKTIKYNKATNQSLQHNNHNQVTPRNNLWQNRTQIQNEQRKKIHSEVQANLLIQKVEQLKNQIRRDIGIAGKLSWNDFKNKYNTKDIHDKNIHLSVADQIIIRTLQAVRQSAQIVRNPTLIDQLSYLYQKNQQYQWNYNHQIKRNQQLRLIVQKYNQNKNISNSYNNYNNKNNQTYTNRSNQQEQQLKDILAQNDSLNQQIKRLNEQNKKLNNLRKQQFDLLSQNINKIQTQQEQIKQKNTLIQQLTQQLQQKDQAIRNLSNVAVTAASNTNTGKDKIIQQLQIQVNTIHKQATQNYNQKQQYKSYYNRLNNEIKQVLYKANATFIDTHPFTTITHVYDFVYGRRQHYKQKYQQKQRSQQQFIRKIKRILNDTQIQRLSDIQNAIQIINNNKIASEQKQTKTLQQIKSIQQLLKNLHIPQPHPQQPQNTYPQPSQQQKITKQITSKLNNLLQSQIRHKDLKLNDRSKILGHTKQEKFIVQQLSRYLGDNAIVRFNLLYRYSQGGNMAQAIQKHPNTLLVIKTKFDVIVACYSTLSYCQTVDMKQRKGLLIQTHTNSSYSLKAGSKPVQYDQNNLIFGNKVIKISKKQRDYKMQIDFNDKNSIFENEKKHKLYDLFKTSDKVIQFFDFQIFQIQQTFYETVLLQRPIAPENLNVIRNSRFMQPKKSQQVQIKQQTKTSVPKTSNRSVGKVTIMELNQQIQRHKSGILVLKKQNEDLKKRVEQLESSTTNETKNKNKSFTGIKQNQDSTLGGLQRIKSQAQQPNLQKQLDEMTKKCKNIEQSLQQRTKRLVQAQNKVKQQQQKIKQLTAAKSKQGLSHTQSYTKQKSQLQNLRKQKQQVETKLQQQRKLIQKNKQELQKKTTQLQQAKKQIQKFKKQLDQQKMKQLLSTKSLQQGVKKQHQQAFQKLSKEKAQLEAKIKQYYKQTNQIQNPGQINNKSQVSGSNNVQKDSSNINQGYQKPNNKKVQFKTVKTFQHHIQPSNIPLVLPTNSDTNQNQNTGTSSQNPNNNESIQKLSKQLQQLKQAASKQKQQKDRKIFALQKQKQNLQINLRSYTAQLTQNYKKMQQLQNQVEKFKQSNQDLLKVPEIKQQNKSPRMKTQSDKSFDNQKQPSKQLKKQIQQNKKLLNKILQSRNTAEKQCSQKSTDLIRIAQKHKKATNELKQLQQKVTKLKQQQKQIVKLMSQIQQNKRLKLQLDEQISKIRKQIRELDEEKNNKAKQSQKQSQQILKLKRQRQQLNKQSKRIQQANSKNQQKLKQLDRIQQVIKQSMEKQQKIQHNTLSLKQKEQHQRIITQQAIKNNEKAQQMLRKTQQQLQKMQKEKLKYGGFPNRLFVGQVLSDQLDRSYIIEQVQKLYPRQKIVQSKFLFSFPLMRKLNAHQIIDQKPHYIIIIKLCNIESRSQKNYTLALYSDRALIKGAPINNGIGFVSAVNNRKTFYLRNVPSLNPRLTQYNQFYIVFGNSQVRFRLNSQYLDINVGHNFRSLETGDLRDPQLFAGTKQTKQSTIKMESYEIYQLFFAPKY